MKNFSQLPLSALLQSNLSKHGFVQPTPVQAQAIEPALAGRDLVATAQTGTGKTLAFVLPLLHLLEQEPRRPGVRAVILRPTRELAMQIHEIFVTMAAGASTRATVVVGGVGESAQLQAIRKGAQVLIATPGRLYDFLSRRLVDLGAVRMLVLDEADRMLDMGFLPTIKRIMAAIPGRPADPVLLRHHRKLGQAPGRIARPQCRAHRGRFHHQARRCRSISHLYEVEQDRKLGLLEQHAAREDGSFLVFARTKHGADRLSRRLAHSGVKTAAIHGDRSQSQRNQALRGFQDGEYRVLVATDVAARGIHVEGIAHVVNYDLPQVPEDFIHRVGRTGRAGARGTASTFATRAERAEIARIERTLNMRLTTRAVSGEVLDDRGKAPVIVIPTTDQRRLHVRSFGPRNAGRRRVSSMM